MTVQNSIVYQLWARRITLATTLIVVVLSWINEVTLTDILIRGVISFLVMYLLMAGILSLFEKTASQNPQRNRLKTNTSETGRGGVIDFSVGDEEPKAKIKAESKAEFKPSSFAGQVDPNLSKGLPGSKQQAEIVRRMGWDDEQK